MAGGSRTTSRPGAGPGRGKPRARTAVNRPPPISPAEPEALPDDSSAPAAPTLRRRLRGSLTSRAITLLLVMLILTISYASSLRIYFAQAHDIASTRQLIVERERLIVDLAAQRARWSDPAYVSAEARARLGWALPGEVGYQVVGEDGQQLNGDPRVSTPEEDEPADAWWGKLWGSVEAADQPTPDP